VSARALSNVHHKHDLTKVAGELNEEADPTEVELLVKEGTAGRYMMTRRRRVK
jgi:hypothetical protein